MSRATKVFALLLRVLLAALLLVSAVAKLLAIDDFELYIFSYGLLPLNISYLAARLCIVAELLLALFIALGWWRRRVNLAAFVLLILFSLFLCYAALIGRTDSCQCMGRLADLNPLQSLLKNALLITLVLLYSRLSRVSRTSRASSLKVILSILFAVAVTVAVFCISVPDNWMFGPEEARYDRELLEESIGPDGVLADEGLAEGHQLMAFVTRGCPYCRMTRGKLGSIAKRNHLDTTLIHYYEPADLPAGLFLRITYGQRPFILLLDDGVPVVTYHYRNISERQVADFLR
ncbi:MAG: DoxX family membrane protein [Bacteroidales bacterium]|nr:DoxX family membrane protein [Bacteroidales bacterium]